MKVITKNRSAYHDYSIEKEYDAGIVLTGYEVKSIRASHVNITDSIIQISNKELWIIGMDIPLYKMTAPQTVPGYEPKGRRKILVTKKELTKIAASLDKPGYVLIPLLVFLSGRGLVKIKMGLAKLMKKIEKKQLLKEKDIKRQMDREIKSMR